jgi:hypothetical protein
MDDSHLFCSIVGVLQYVTITWLDILFTVNRVSQFMHSPILVHRASVKRILRYLKDTLDYGLTIQPSSSLAVHAFADLMDIQPSSSLAIHNGLSCVSWSQFDLKGIQEIVYSGSF